MPALGPLAKGRALALVTVSVVAACGDRSPPALWPEPPPPTLARPIGIDDPAALSVGTSAAGADEPDPAVVAAEARAAAQRAKLPRAAATEPEATGSTVAETSAASSTGGTDTAG